MGMEIAAGKPGLTGQSHGCRPGQAPTGAREARPDDRLRVKCRDPSLTELAGAHCGGTGCALDRDDSRAAYVSSTTPFRSTPISGTSTSTTSPGLSHLGGW